METIGLILIFLVILARSLARRHDPATLGFFLSSAGQARSSKKQQDMANMSAWAQILMDQKAEESALAELEPWRATEESARVSMADLLGYNGPDAANAAADALMRSPAVVNRLKTGTATIDRSRAARGGLFSGRTGVELQKMGQDVASEEYGSEFNRRKAMMDWAYGNATNRAKIKGGKWESFGDTIGKQYDTLQDTTRHKYDMFSKNSSEGMQLLGSMYGANKKGGR